MGDERIEQQVGDFLAEEAPEGMEFDNPIQEEEDFFLEPQDEDSTEDEDVDEDVPTEDEDESIEEDAEVSDSADDTSPVDDDTPAATDQPVVDTPDELAQLKAQNATLLQTIEELQGQIGQPAAPEAQQQATQQQQTTETVQPQVPSISAEQVHDFVGERDLDSVLADKNEFNKFMTEFAVAVTQNAVQRSYQSLPQMVNAQVQSQQTLQTYVTEFYKENEDLAAVKKTVGGVANQVAAEHPEYSLNQVFEETATRTRKLLGLEKKAKGEQPSDTPSDPPAVSPALPKKGGSRKGGAGKALTGQAKHIQDVL